MLLVAATLFRVEVTLKVAVVPLSETSAVDTEIVRDEDEIVIQEGTVPQVGVDAPSDFCKVSVSVAKQLLSDLYAATSHV